MAAGASSSGPPVGRAAARAGLRRSQRPGHRGAGGAADTADGRRRQPDTARCALLEDSGAGAAGGAAAARGAVGAAGAAGARFDGRFGSDCMLNRLACVHTTTGVVMV